MTFKLLIMRIHWFFSSQFGLDPFRIFNALRGIPSYLSDFVIFKKAYKGKVEIMPCLFDKYDEGGSTKSEYFWQDLMVSRFIYKANPVRHVDIGSRIDGFVAHIASFRDCEVFDVRPISTKIPGVKFHQADLMDPIKSGRNSKFKLCDSISCLHALEHFGLGRYGDPIDPEGYKRGIFNISELLEFGGVFYLSTPVGEERVEFNANWIFNPFVIVNCAKNANLKLEKLFIISALSRPKQLKINNSNLLKLSKQRYQLVLFVFKKSN